MWINIGLQCRVCPIFTTTCESAKANEAELLIWSVACPLNDGWSGQHNTTSESPFTSMKFYWLKCFTLDLW